MYILAAWCRDGLMAFLLSRGQKLPQRSIYEYHWQRFGQGPSVVQETCSESRLEMRGFRR